MSGHNSKRNSLRTAMVLMAIMFLGTDDLSAEQITRTVNFQTVQTPGMNQLALNGKLDTLAQALRVQPFGATTVGTQGTLSAEVTFESVTFELLGVKFLQNSFSQTGMTLTYHVPGTTRSVTFTGSDINFSMEFEDIVAPPPVVDPPSNLLAAQIVQQPSGLKLPPSSYKMTQNQGMAQIVITNRPPAQQNLYEQQISSKYVTDGPDPLVELGNFIVIAPGNGSENYQIELMIPLTHQQLQYTGVGLPVTLDYSGSLQLVGSLVPEPSAALLSSICAIGMLLRRQRDA